MGGGASSQAQSQINDNRQYANGTGSDLLNRSNANADAYQQLAAQRAQQADAAYAPIVAGTETVGYTPEQIAAIQDKSGLDAVKGNPGVGMTSDTQMDSNYLTPDEQKSELGDQTGINTGLNNIQQNVSDYTNNVRMTPEQQQAMATSAARSAANVDQAAAQANVERARSAGLDPLGIASYTARTNRTSQQNQANAAAQARVQAEQERVARENQIETVAQNANTQNLGAQQTMESNASSRSKDIANNRQTTGEGNQATKFNQAQQADNEASQRAQYVDSQTAGRAGAIADKALDNSRADQAEYRQWLAAQQGGYTQAGLTEEGLGAGVYSTTGQQLGQSTNTQVQADARPSPWLSVLSAGASTGAAFVPKPSDFRLKENLTVLGMVGPLAVYSYNFKGVSGPEVGFIAQEVFKHFPDCVVVGGADATKDPWKVDYSKVLKRLGVN